VKPALVTNSERRQLDQRRRDVWRRLLLSR